MIYTVTFNPSLDYVVDVPDFQIGKTNRTAQEQLYPGGKGVNVSIMLRHLGLLSTALGFSAGFVGAEIERRLGQMGITADFIPVEGGNSRINVKLRSIEGTEINGMGPAIGTAQQAALMRRLDALGEGDVLILAGSIPSAMTDGAYGEILARLAGRGVLAVVDATKDLLLHALAHRPFLVKPNNHELGELFGVALRTREETIPYARALQARGARNVLVSMAGEGAVLAAEGGQVFAAPAPKGDLVNGVGAGDSMVAGFLAGWLRTGSHEEAFRMGLAAGSASAFSQHLAARDAVEAIYRQIDSIHIL